MPTVIPTMVPFPGLSSSLTSLSSPLSLSWDLLPQITCPQVGASGTAAWGTSLSLCGARWALGSDHPEAAGHGCLRASHGLRVDATLLPEVALF